jgi:hypothetical protein
VGSTNSKKLFWLCFCVTKLVEVATVAFVGPHSDYSSFTYVMSLLHVIGGLCVEVKGETALSHLCLGGFRDSA